VRVGEDAILEALDEPTDVEFAGVALSDAIGELSRNSRVAMLIDDKALTDLGIDAASTEVTLHVSGLRARSALNLLLRPLELTWLIDDEVLVVTTLDDADSRLLTRLYPVGDLLQPPANDPLSTPTADDLVEVLAATIHPDSWADVGGPGSIKVVRETLVVMQTYSTHERVARLLKELRAATAEQAVALAPANLGPVTRTYFVSGVAPEALAKAVTQTVAPGTWGEETGYHIVALTGHPPLRFPGVGMSLGGGISGEGIGGGGFGGGGFGGGGYFALADEAATTVAVPPPAVVAGAGEALRMMSGWLVVRSTPEVHRSIERFLHGLGVLNATQSVREPTP